MYSIEYPYKNIAAYIVKAFNLEHLSYDMNINNQIPLYYY